MNNQTNNTKTFGIANKYLLFGIIAIVGFATISSGTLSSVTADYFFGDGSNLTGLNARGDTDYFLYQSGSNYFIGNSTLATKYSSTDPGLVLSRVSNLGNVSVRILPGKYTTSYNVNVTHDNVTIILSNGVSWTTSNNTDETAAFSAYGYSTASTTLNGAAAASQSDIVVTSAAGMVVNNYVWLYNSTASSGQVEVGRIDKISGTTITLDRPLRFAWDSGESVLAAVPVQNFNLIGEGSATIYATAATTGKHAVGYFWAINGEIKGLNIYTVVGSGRPILLSTSAGTKGSAWITVRSNKVFSTDNGIETYINSYENVIDSNTVLNAGADTGAISVRGTGHRISNNIITNYTQDGINLGSSNSTMVVHNTVSGRSGIIDNGGIRIGCQSRGFVIAENTAQGNQYGVYVFCSTTSTITKGLILGNMVYGNSAGSITNLAGYDVTKANNLE